MKFVLTTLSAVFIAVLTLGCVNGGDGNGNGSQGAYDSFTNGEFYIEYPSGWDVNTDFEEDEEWTDETWTEIIAEDLTKDVYFYVTGYKVGPMDANFREYINNNEAEIMDWGGTILSKEIDGSEATIEYTSELTSGKLIYTHQKWIICDDTVYICSAMTSESPYSTYIGQLDHIISSFECV